MHIQLRLFADYNAGGTVVGGVGIVNGVAVVVIANVGTILGGTINPPTMMRCKPHYVRTWLRFECVPLPACDLQVIDCVFDSWPIGASGDGQPAARNSTDGVRWRRFACPG